MIRFFEDLNYWRILFTFFCIFETNFYKKTDIDFKREETIYRLKIITKITNLIYLIFILYYKLLNLYNCQNLFQKLFLVAILFIQ